MSNTIKSVGEILRGLAGEKFESKEHYYFYCKKILTNKDCFHMVKEENFQIMCTLIFIVSEQRRIQIKDLNLKEPKDVFIKLLQSSYSLSEIHRSINLMDEIMKEYFSMLKIENPDFKDFPLLHEYCYDDIKEYEKAYGRVNKDDNSYCTLRVEVGELYEKTLNKAGVYFLYNKYKELVYIGKSTSNLASRLLISAKEREIIFFARYIITQTKSDANIYEMYYIAKNKPILNKNSKEEDLATFELPEIKLSDFYQLYDFFT